MCLSWFDYPCAKFFRGLAYIYIYDVFARNRALCTMQVVYFYRLRQSLKFFLNFSMSRRVCFICKLYQYVVFLYIDPTQGNRLLFQTRFVDI